MNDDTDKPEGECGATFYPGMFILWALFYTVTYPFRWTYRKLREVIA